MQNTLEKGRSMIEMLGVLSIVGVISLGGLKIVGQFQSNQKSTQIVNDFVNFVSMTRKLACQFDEGYDASPSGYGTMVRQSKAYPSHLTIKEGSGSFYGINDVAYYVTAGSNYPKKLEYVVGNLTENDCIRLATTDFGHMQKTGFVDFQINASAGKKAVDGTSSYPMNISQATELCSQKSNGITFTYTGCM